MRACSRELGPDTGFDSIGDSAVAGRCPPAGRAGREDQLPKTILYSLNPTETTCSRRIIGSFQGGGVPGKIQLGSAWWFNDTKEGMIAAAEVARAISACSAGSSAC